MKEQKKIGILLSYFNLILSIGINIFLVPLLIHHLSDDNYSIYKVMHSFAGPLIVFNLGVSTVVTRSIVRCRLKGEDGIREKRNTLAIAMLASILMAGVVALAGFVMQSQIPTIYANTYTHRQIEVAQKIFLLFVLSTVFHVLTDTFTGCALGNERYLFNAGIVTAKYLMRIGLIVACVKLELGVVAIASVDMVVSVAVFVLSGGYSFFVLREFPKLTYIDRHELVQILSFSAAIFMQAIVNQINSNIDTILLGAMVVEKGIVTMYSSALTIYAAYNSLVSVIVQFFLPDAAKLVLNDASGDELTDFVVKPGRFQAVISVGVIVGFGILGREFISLWIGGQYISAYYVALVLMIPVTIPLVQNSAIAILDASLKRTFRSVVLFSMALINFGSSIFLIKWFGFWGAALGTILSLIIGHGLLMNWYYAKVFKMRIWRMFRDIFKGILPSGLFAGVICLPAVIFLPGGVTFFLIKGLIFVIVYAVFLWVVGFQPKERELVTSMLTKLKRK